MCACADRAILRAVNKPFEPLSAAEPAEPAPAAAGNAPLQDTLQEALRLSEQYAAAGAYREALEQYQRYHRLYLQQLEQRLAGQAAAADPSLIDASTGLASRRALQERLPGLLSRAQGGQQGLCVVRLELDPLPQRLSSTLRLALQQELGQLLRASSRSKDVASSEQGEALTLVLCDVDLALARTVCERLRRAVASHDWSRLQAGLKPSLSMGLTALRSGDDMVSLLARAEAGLLNARRDGRNCLRSG